MSSIPVNAQALSLSLTLVDDAGKKFNLKITAPSQGLTLSLEEVPGAEPGAPQAVVDMTEATDSEGDNSFGTEKDDSFDAESPAPTKVPVKKEVEVLSSGSESEEESVTDILARKAKIKAEFDDFKPDESYVSSEDDKKEESLDDDDEFVVAYTPPKKFIPAIEKPTACRGRQVGGGNTRKTRTSARVAAANLDVANLNGPPESDDGAYKAFDKFSQEW